MLEININKKESYIPINIGDLNFKFDTSDESINRFEKRLKSIEKKMKKQDVKNATLEDAKNTLEYSFDTLLGDGTFKQLYEETPSVFVLADYFQDLTIALRELIENLDNENRKKKVEKYLRSKKK